MATPQRAVFIDGSNLIYRAFFALPASLRTSTGMQTNAIYGFALMFNKLFAGKMPAAGAVVFDTAGPTFRDEKFADYKGTRQRMPDELRAQTGHIDALCAGHGFKTLRVPGVEADDVIGTLARIAREAGHEVWIISSDKDFAQLIDDQVKMVDTLKDVTFDSELVRKKWGVRPDQIIDLLALMGDKVDNVPGVAGIGAKGAVDLLQTYGSVDGIYANLDALKGRKLSALTEGRDMAMLSRELVTIDQHVTLPVTLEDLTLRPPPQEALNQIYVDLEFYSLISDAAHDALSASDAPVHYERVDTHDGLKAVTRTLVDAERVAVVPVFADLAPAICDIIGVAVAVEPGRAWYLAFDGRGPSLGGRGFAAFARILADPAIPKVCHDAKALWRGLTRQGFQLQGVAFDTMLASYLVDPTKIIPHRLDQCTKEYLQRTVRPPKSVIGAGKKQTTFAQADPEALTEWACHLADAVVAMAPVVAARLEEAGQSAQLMERDLPLSWVLGQMEVDGILVDAADLDVLGVELRERLAEMEAEIHGLAGRSFNIASTKQLSAVLFDELGLPIIKRTKTGYSTAQDVLEKLTEHHEIADKLLQWRSLAKLINTYTDVLSRSVDAHTKRIHTTFQQTTAATGRLITTDPDLQRTPIHGPEGQRIRQAFIAPQDHRIISADWSQIELRVLAHVSEDPGLVGAFADKTDVHRLTASKIFDVSPKAVTKAQRNVGKTVNFATIYGQGATALSQQLKIPRKEAAAYIKNYFRHYSGVRDWLDRTIAEARERGYVTTLAGRRRAIPELSSKSPMERQAGERIAANTPIQGSVADLCKQVMLELPQRFAAAGLSARMLLQIHDELLFEVPLSEVEATSAIIRERMEHTVTMRVPLVVDIGVGHSWGEAH